MNREDPGFVDFDLVKTLEAVVRERLLPIPGPIVPPGAPTMQR
jgi:hypothetical protein